MSETSDEAVQKAIKKSRIHRCVPEQSRVSRLSPRIKVPRLSSILRLLTPGGRAARVPQSACSAHRHCHASLPTSATQVTYASRRACQEAGNNLLACLSMSHPTFCVSFCASGLHRKLHTLANAYNVPLQYHSVIID